MEDDFDQMVAGSRASALVRATQHFGVDESTPHAGTVSDHVDPSPSTGAEGCDNDGHAAILRSWLSGLAVDEVPNRPRRTGAHYEHGE